MVAILDFGSQYTQLIARRVRELKIYCEIYPYNVPASNLKEKNVRVLILSGGPGHITESELSFMPDKEIFRGQFKILGICFGMQVIAKFFGGKVERGKVREYGKTVFYPEKDIIFEDVPQSTVVWMSHYDQVTRLPDGFKNAGRTGNCKIAAIKNIDGSIYGLQFHPEVLHTEKGKTILKNFLFKVCALGTDWTPSSMVDMAKNEIKSKIGNGKIVCALSGGVDSSTLAVLLHQVAGNNSLSVFVNHGLLRKNEEVEVKNALGSMVNMKYVDASEIFLSKLKGVADPEKKRKIIGETFIRVFEKEAKEFGADFLAQGTLYPDVIESVSVFGGPTSRIKTHHNVGGLPEKMDLKLVEPFRYLFKDEVRKIAKAIGLPSNLIQRHPFPGPGLAVRIIGEVDKEKIEILREVDAIYIDELRKANLYNKIWQAFAVLLPVKSVGVMGDQRTYQYVVALRAVTSVDAMTADWARIPLKVLEKISSRIVNEVKTVNRVVYDITSKPPATIEWE
ncbi:MAG: glutamine-hydrolyzing GMP synthase [Candidatus Omnitrophica bacterium]|nr:glutamine-hydrolyzing GMP synthase [Candidatus Omnitrophota bacterium]MCM8828641.1 glutamine-hydrolyzing GMP synthase [Candidatus Omnitrophota bacterium]